MTLNKLAFSLVGSLALATVGFAGTAPSGKKCTTCTPAPAAESDLGFTLSAGYDSKYIFRGLDLGDNWVTTSLDWSLPLTSALRLETGASYGVSADDSFLGVDGLSYQRLELNAGLVFDLGPVDLGVGYRWYNHQGDGDILLEDGHEVGLTLAAKAGPLNIGVGGYYDFAIDGWFFELGVNSEIKLTDRISLVPGASIGYGVDYNYHVEGASGIDGFSHVGLSLALPIKLTKSATLTPYIAGNLPIDELDGLDNQLFGGASISVKF
jgi:hypothetical protein